MSVYIKFENQTYGERAKSLLSSKGIPSRLKRNPNPNHREGCGFALFVSGDVWKAFDILNQALVPNLGVENHRDRI